MCKTDTISLPFQVNLKAYVFVPIGVPGATSGSMFTPVPVEITAYEPEVIGLDLLHKTKVITAVFGYYDFLVAKVPLKMTVT